MIYFDFIWGRFVELFRGKELNNEVVLKFMYIVEDLKSLFDEKFSLSVSVIS